MSDNYFSPQPWHVRLSAPDFSESMERRDRTYRLIAAAPKLYDLARQYASECAECNGIGVLQFESDTYPGRKAGETCPECADIRDVLNEIEGPFAHGNPRGWVEVKR